jgi:histidinol-phosphatase (PHP family)
MNFDKTYRMSFEDMYRYETQTKFLKEKYKDKITILLGYEVDFLPNYMSDKVLNADVDYLIGSVHFLDKWGFDNPEFIKTYQEKDIDEIWKKYFDTVKEMVKDGLNDHQVREAMKKNGMITIADKLREMLIAGDTSYEEAIRVGLMDG